MKKVFFACVGLLLGLTAQAQLIDNHIEIETKTVEDRTYIEIIDNLKKDVTQEYYHITWKMEDNDIDLIIPMDKVEFLNSDYDAKYVEFELDYNAVQKEIVKLEDTISKVKIYS